MRDDLLDVYVSILCGPCVGQHARIINVVNFWLPQRYVVEIAASTNGNAQVTILTRDEFEVL